MDELRNHIQAVEETDAVDQQHLEAAQAPSGFSQFLKKTRAYVTGGMIAISPVLGSCVNVDTQNETAEQGGGNVSESTESLQDRTVNLWYNGKDWHFEGKYPKNFRLVVDVDGKQVFDEEVQSFNGAFDVKGLAGETAHDIKIAAYNPDADSTETFEIPIEPNVKTPGMYGVPKFHNPEYPAK